MPIRVVLTGLQQNKCSVQVTPWQLFQELICILRQNFWSLRWFKRRIKHTTSYFMPFPKSFRRDELICNIVEVFIIKKRLYFIGFKIFFPVLCTMNHSLIVLALTPSKLSSGSLITFMQLNWFSFIQINAL